METLRILHIADVHLDTAFSGRDESLRRKLRDACRQAFTGAIDVAIERGVHALLIAGDLFDNERLSFATERLLLAEMVRMRDVGIPVLYATGNHDPGRVNYRAQQLDWAENVHLFASTKPETVQILGRDGAEIGWLTAAGHSSQRENRNLAAEYPRAKKRLPHVGMLHTQVLSARGVEHHERYAPCTIEDLQAPSYDYWALGHVHLRQRVPELVEAWYPGNIQGRNPGETGVKGALYVEITKDSPVEPEFVPLSPIVWDHIELACPEDADTVTELASKLSALIDQGIDRDDGREHLVRVDLTGESILASELNDPENLRELEEIIRSEEGFALLEIRPRSLVTPVDLASYADSATVLGEVIQMMRSLGTDDELLDAVRPEQLAGVSVDDVKQYLRELVPGMEREAVARMVSEQKR